MSRTVVDFSAGAAVVSFFGGTMLEDEFLADGRRVALLRGFDPTAPAEVTWSGPDAGGAFTAHVAVGE